MGLLFLTTQLRKCFPPDCSAEVAETVAVTVLALVIRHALFTIIFNVIAFSWIAQYLSCRHELLGISSLSCSQVLFLLAGAAWIWIP